MRVVPASTRLYTEDGAMLRVVETKPASDGRIEVTLEPAGSAQWEATSLAWFVLGTVFGAAVALVTAALQ